ncbi:hypothetical protein Hypma_008510 [Hypsizygus marmoreus]|uniref:Uncharacterized protein n=1 Tax=Hypsizygus marmoreus TaxID=39966 RepID=A0A369JVC6_HYPMA|nr:hypothetical protein Hypma_008510 [Hypsizygus marmoreus]
MVQNNIILAAAAAFAVGFRTVVAVPLSHDGMSSIQARDSEGLYARAGVVKAALNKYGPKVAKVGKEYGQNVWGEQADKLKAKTEKKEEPLPEEAKQLVGQVASTSYNPALVNAAIHPQPKPKSKKKGESKKARDLSDVYERDVDQQDLFARTIQGLEDFLVARWLELEELD